MLNHTLHKLSIVFLTVFLLFGCKKTGEESVVESDDKVKAILIKYNQVLNSGQTKKAIQYLDSSYYKLDDVSEIALWDIYRNKSKFYLNYDFDIKKAELYIDSMALKIKDTTSVFKYEYAQTLFAKGDVLLAQRRYNESFERYYEGRTYALKNLDSCKLSGFTAQLGSVKLKQKKYPEALWYYKQALKERQSCSTRFEDSFVYTQSTMNAIAMVYEKMGSLDSAIIYYHQTLDFISSTKTSNKKDSAFLKMAYGVVCGNLGGAYLKKGNFVKAEPLLKESIVINDHEEAEAQDAKTAKIKLADLYLQTNRLELGYNLLNSLIPQIQNDQSSNLQKKELLLRYYYLLKTYYERKGNTDLAYATLNNYHLLNDSLLNITQGLAYADMDMVFALNEQKFKTSILQKENEIKTTYIIGIVIVALITIIFLVFFWVNLKKSRNYILKLSRLNYQNQQTLAALEQSQSDNDKIMRIVAHDLRNPLSGITGVVALMLEEEGFSEETREELSLIKTTSENSLALVNELLHINFELENLKMEVLDMDVLIQYCAELLKYKAETKNQQIIATSFPVAILANREKIWRVLSNLIGNAIKFSPNHSTITIGMETNEHKIKVFVSDEGIGIMPNMENKLFDMFTTAKRVGTAGEESFGMGLSICKQIITGHGGEIWFERKVNQGTTFYFTLPINQ